ncbi:DNA damage-binding protein [Hortaea werneckii]|uniref:DNA damage-binding protein CMR1 n=2 Tax=Hortaea werneckii TaxID=91943 RepID=A0A3M7IYH5_HORWE|nr:DNA damage-binding protein [Hortaea werneckii]OTA39768.1 DNA damage-binding protein CMR1 [Hortaea werneckii EXF-2000]KAI6827706.1 DNA damage-binding protein [Hortaea werneckii]KAI6924495.1 DNA damage-binding protein [Hortaea werneckii]KAI6939901.1 DNA damage-binding protein [Hortaea werneckii]
MAVKKGNEMSEYEQARQEKIAKNQQLLQQLQLDAQQTGIGPKSKPKPQQNSGQKRKRPVEKVKKEDAGPRRTSARLQGIVADSEVARQKSEADAEAYREQEKAKRQRVSEDINLVDAVVNGRTWNKAGNWLTAFGPANPGERTFTEQHIKDTSDKELRALRERMNNLQLWEGAEPNRIKITPERIYSLGFHPNQEKALVFAGDKLGNLGLFDASQTAPQEVKQEADDADEDGDADDEFEPAISTFKVHARTISAFQFAPNDANALYTASYDSSVRKLDLEKGQAIEVYAPEDKAADAAISGVEISRTDPNMLHFTTLDGAFGIHDLRTPAHETVESLQLSEKKIGGFSLHPAHPHIVATASLDRTMKIWDLRKISGKHDSRSPHLVGEHLSKLSVSHANFNSAGQVATASYDDTVKIYDFSSAGTWSPNQTLSEEEMEPATIIPHNNQTGRWVTILRAQWQMQPQDGIQRFCIGNMNRFVDVYTSKGQQLAQLGGEGITAVPAVAKLHDSMDWIAAGTASGKLCLWQ